VTTLAAHAPRRQPLLGQEAFPRQALVGDHGLGEAQLGVGRRHQGRLPVGLGRVPARGRPGGSGGAGTGPLPGAVTLLPEKRRRSPGTPPAGRPRPPPAGGLTARGAAPPLAAGTPMADPADLPTGAVTFRFTDLEGSTRLLEAHPAAMRAALARHDALIERLAAEHPGGGGAAAGGGGQPLRRLPPGERCCRGGGGYSASPARGGLAPGGAPAGAAGPAPPRRWRSAPCGRSPRPWASPAASGWPRSSGSSGAAAEVAVPPAGTAGGRPSWPWTPPPCATRGLPATGRGRAESAAARSPEGRPRAERADSGSATGRARAEDHSGGSR
jgi:hypothetical protein